MSRKYESLEELRRKKKLLKQEIDGLEDLLTFKNTKESLSAFTNGLTDQYLQEKVDEDGDEKVVLEKMLLPNRLLRKLKEP
jgi:hypothetical protein